MKARSSSHTLEPLPEDSAQELPAPQQQPGTAVRATRRGRMDHRACEKEIEGLKAHAETQERQLETKNMQLACQQAQLAALQAQLAAQQTQLAALQAQITAEEARFARLQEQKQGLLEAKHALQQRVDELEQAQQPRSEGSRGTRAMQTGSS